MISNQTKLTYHLINVCVFSEKNVVVVDDDFVCKRADKKK